MARVLASLVTILGLFGSSASLLAHVIGKDDRTNLNDAEENQFAAVGKVHCQDPHDRNLEYWTTGTLVGDQRTVFTSGHFGVKPRSRDYPTHIFPVEHCEFRIYAPHGGRFPDGYSYKRFAIVSGQRAAPPEAYIDYKADRADWAVLSLQGSGVDASLAPAIKVRLATMDQLVDQPDTFMVAYHDRSKAIDADVRVLSPRCAIRRDRRSHDDTWFLLNCDTNKGSSGGLVFAEDASGEPVAIGYATSDGLAKERDRNNYGQPFNGEARSKIPGADSPFLPKPEDQASQTAQRKPPHTLFD